MYLVDTKVISELRKIESGRVNRRVEAWIEIVDAEVMFLSVVTVLELKTGALRIGRRAAPQGQMLEKWIDELILPSFAGRVLPIDLAITLRCAAMHVPDRRPDRDGWIAATALVLGMTVVTRNVADFEPMGVAVVNPWES